MKDAGPPLDARKYKGGGPYKIVQEEMDDPLFQERRETMVICVECVYCNELQRARCGNPDLPLKDFIYGIKHCDDYNARGDCKGFKAKPEPDFNADKNLASKGIHKSEDWL